MLKHSAFLPDIPVDFVGAATSAMRHDANDRGAILALPPQFKWRVPLDERRNARFAASDCP
jgi:hypothetical protein